MGELWDAFSALPRPFVPADNVFVMGAVLVGLAFFGLYVDTTRIGRQTSGVVWLLVAATALSNTGVTPLTSPSYDFVFRYVVSLSIPLLLFKADLRRVAREAGPVLLAFLVGMTGVVAGAVIGSFAVPQGDFGFKLAGVYSAAWIGGAVGMVGSAEALHLTPTQYTAVVGASSVVSITGLVALVAIPSLGLLRKFIPSPIMDEAKSPALATQASATKLNFVHLSGALTASFAICATARFIADNVSVPGVDLHDFNVLIVTALAVLAANLFPKSLHALDGDFDLGMFLLYIFFAAIGSTTDARQFLTTGPLVLAHGFIVLGVFLVVMLGLAKLLRIDLARSVIGGAAGFVGVAPTAAIASGRGWEALVIPGIMCALLGKAIGTFIGVAVASLLLQN